MATQWRVIRRLFRELQLQRRVPLPHIQIAAPDVASEPRAVATFRSSFHIERGKYGDVTLDGLNVALAIHTPGPMADGDWSVAAYIDERADDKQTEALGAIFTGAGGGPMAAFAPMVGRNLGARKVPITYKVEGKKRSAEIPGVLHMAVEPLPSLHPGGEMWVNSGHPISPDKLALAVGAPGTIRSPIMECAGTILGKKATTPRSTGRTERAGRGRPGS